MMEEPDLAYWRTSLDLAMDCVGLDAEARPYLKMELLAAITRFKVAMKHGVTLPCHDLMLHTQRQFLPLQPPPAPIAHPPHPVTLPPAPAMILSHPAMTLSQPEGRNITMSAQQLAALQSAIL